MFQKKCPDFKKVCTIYVHLWVKFHWKSNFKSILEKKHCGAILCSVIHETFIEMPLFQEISPALKNSWFAHLSNNSTSMCLSWKYYGICCSWESASSQGWSTVYQYSCSHFGNMVGWTIWPFCFCFFERFECCYY